MPLDTTVLYLFGGAAIVGIAWLVVSTFKKGGPKKPKVNKKKEKALKELEAIKEAVTPPPDVLPPPDESPKPMEQLPIPKSIAIELTRIKEGNKRAIIRKGNVTLVPRFGRGKDIFFFYVGNMGYFIDPSKTIEVKTVSGRRKKEVVTEKLVYDVMCPEPLDKNGNITFSWDIERLLVDSGMDQYITVVTLEGTFQLTSNLMKAIIVVVVLGVFIGLAVNGTVGLTPKTVIHYVP